MMTNIQPPTKRQREVLDYLGRYIQAHGIAPTLTEIGSALSLRSLATVHKHLEQLRIKGHIRRQWNRSRYLQLVSDLGCCPTCGRVLEKVLDEAKVAIDDGRKHAIVGSTSDVSASAVPTTTEVP